MKFTRSATNDNPLSLYEKRRVVIKAYQPGSVVISTLIIPTVIIITAAAAAATAYAEVVASSSSTISTSYGLDVSFPMQQDHVTTNYDWLPHNTLPKLYPTPEGYVGMPIQPLGNRQEFYSEYIRGCIDHYDVHGRRCLDSERDRVSMNKRQPQSMVNYTDVGYTKTRLPDDVWKLLIDFWKKNKAFEWWKIEEWPVGNTYTNHWESPSYLLSVEDDENFNLRGGGNPLRSKIWNAIQPLMEAWLGQDLQPCMMHGIRVYTEGAVLAPHVDRLPLVSSAIINIAQDLDDETIDGEPSWPLEVYGHDGVARNISIEPGEVFMWESHSVIHGRPFPMKGRFMANLFVHFEPTGHSLKHHDIVHDRTGSSQQYRESVERGAGGHEGQNSANYELGDGNEDASDGPDADLPIYMMPNSPEVKHYRKLKKREDRKKVDEAANKNDDGASAASSNKSNKKTQRPLSTSSNWGSPLHSLAASGRVDEMYNIIEDGGDHLIHSKDSNGWTPLHEGARGGHLTVVQLLVAKGANINERTHDGVGGTALFYASDGHGQDSLVAQFLQSHGAVLIPPDEL